MTAAKDAICGKPTISRDGDAIIIDIPMRFRRRCGRKEIIMPPGVSDASQSPPPNPLALALARAFRWQEMIESGEVESNCELARKLKLDQSYIARTIRLASLAPDIIEAILNGQEFDEISLGHLRRDMPLLWQEQRKILNGSDSETD